MNTDNVNNTGKKAGRSFYVPLVPTENFTIKQLMIANGVDPDTGKGERCSKLTLINWKNRSLENGTLTKLDISEKSNPNGRGRNREIFCLTCYVKNNTIVPKQVSPEIPAPTQATDLVSEINNVAVDIKPPETTINIGTHPIEKTPEQLAEERAEDETFEQELEQEPPFVPISDLSPNTQDYEKKKAELLNISPTP